MSFDRLGAACAGRGQIGRRLSRGSVKVQRRLSKQVSAGGSWERLARTLSTLYLVSDLTRPGPRARRIHLLPFPPRPFPFSPVLPPRPLPQDPHGLARARRHSAPHAHESARADRHTHTTPRSRGATRTRRHMYAAPDATALHARDATVTRHGARRPTHGATRPWRNAHTAPHAHGTTRTRRHPHGTARTRGATCTASRARRQTHTAPREHGASLRIVLIVPGISDILLLAGPHTSICIFF